MTSSAASTLGTDITTDEPVILEQEQRLKGLYVIGKTGSGKTTLLVNLILQDIEQGMGVCFITPHGDAITDILKRLRPSEREQDVILLDPMDKTHAFGLNLFQCNDPTDQEEVSRVISSVIEIFAKLFTQSGDLMKDAPNMAETLQMALPVLLAHQSPRMTIAEIPLLTMDATARAKLLAPLDNSSVELFWKTYGGWNRKDQDVLTGSTRKRVNDFLINPLVFQIIGQSETSITFRQIMDERKILLVKLPRKPETVASLLGSVLIEQLAAAAFSREDTLEDQRVQFNLYADEYQRFSTPTFAELLTEVRKYKIATCIAHQFRDQLDKANRGATLNADNLVVFAVSGEDAQELALQFDATPKRKKKVQRQRLEPKYKEWDEWVWTDKEAERFYNNAWREASEERSRTDKSEERIELLEKAFVLAFHYGDDGWQNVGGFSEWYDFSPSEVQRLIDGQPPAYKGHSPYYDSYGKHTWDELFLPANDYMNTVEFPLYETALSQVRLVKYLHIPDVKQELMEILHPYYQRGVTSTNQTFPHAVSWLRNKARSMMEVYQREKQYWQMRFH